MAITAYTISQDGSTVLPRYACGKEAPAVNVHSHGERYAITKMLDDDQRHEYSKKGQRITTACEKCVTGTTDEEIKRASMTVILDALRGRIPADHSELIQDRLEFADAVL